MEHEYLHGRAFVKKSKGKLQIFETPYGLGDFAPVLAEGTTKPRMLKDRFADIVNVKDFGAVGDGVHDDTEAIQAAATNATGRILFFPSGKYKISQLDVPSDVDLAGSVQLVDAGVLGNDTHLVTLRAGCRADEMTITLDPAGNADVYRHGIKLGSRCKIGRLEVTAVSRINGEAMHASGNDIYVGFLYTSNVNRGGDIGAYQDITASGKTADGFSHYKNITLGGYFLDGVVQGLRIGRASHCRVGDGIVIGLPDDVEKTPSNGYNGLYISASDNIVFGDVRIERSLEHGIRVGGDDRASESFFAVSHDIHFSKIISSKHGGAALKIAPGFKQACYNISVDQLVSIDSGLRPRSITRRESALRVSHCRGFHCGEVISRLTDISVIGTSIEDLDTGTSRTYEPDTDVVEITNAKNVMIDLLSADAFTRSLVSITEKNDVAVGVDISSYSELECRGIYIGAVSARDNPCTGYYLLRFDAAEMVVGSIHLSDVLVDGDGFSGYALGYNEAKHHGVTIDALTTDKMSAAGLSDGLRIRSRTLGRGVERIWSDSALDLGNALSSSAVVVRGPEVDGASSGCGGAIMFSRLSGFRPSGGIAAYQNGLGGDAGIGFYVSSGHTASNIVQAAWAIVPDKTSLIPLNDGTSRLGDSAHRVGEIFASTGAINTSDERAKTGVTDTDDALMRAWGKVNFKVFQFKDAVEKKGADARLHVGVIAQQVIEAFASEGLDATRYGLLCYDKWDAYDTQVVVVDKPAVVDENGQEIEAEKAHTEISHHEAGDRYGIRYEEALALEAAYQRWKLQKIEATLVTMGVAL